MAKAMFSDFAGEIPTRYRLRTQLFIGASYEVIQKLTSESLRRLIMRVSAVYFYVGKHDLLDAFKENWPDDDRQPIAFIDPTDNSLHLNGGKESGDVPNDAIAQIYAHEIAHAIDLGEDDSGAADWLSAWRKELSGGRLGPNAASSAPEGWADFGELAILDRVTAKRLCPRCWKAWNERGLLR